MVNVCVIALIGLPGVGKTTFCRNITKSLVEYNFMHICYDDEFSYVVGHQSQAKYKLERAKVLEKIAKSIQQLMASSSRDSIILCDDNNYYSAMRYEIYKLCRQYQSSFGQIHFAAALDVALAQNAVRKVGRLPADVIIQMSNRLDRPSAKSQWEINTLKIEDSYDIANVQTFFERSFANPPKVRENVPKQKSTDVAQVIHDIDIFLRKSIGSAIKQSHPDNVRELSRTLTERRRQILQDVRQHKISPSELEKSRLQQRLFSS